MANEWTPVDTDVHEAEGSPQENFSAETGFNATVMLRVPWNDRYAVMDDILQNQYTYPRCPGSQCNALSGSCRPAPAPGQLVATGTGGSLAEYTEALLTILYSQKIHRDEGGGPTPDVFAESIEPSAEFITLNPKKFRWGGPAGDKLEPEEAPGKLVVGFDYIQTRYNLTELPIGVLSPGRVNDAVITARLLELDFPIETLLYHNSQPVRTISVNGLNKWMMMSRFGYREQGWNKFWRASPAGYEWIYEAGGGIYRNFPLGDFTDILV